MSGVMTLRATRRSEVTQPSTKDLLTFVVQVRRGVRNTMTMMDKQRSTIHHWRNALQALKERKSPFDAARIAEHETLLAAAMATLEEIRELRKTYGHMLTDAAPAIDAGTTLAQRCEVLNVNVADRTDLTEEDGIISIAYIHRLEDSAATRGQEDAAGLLFQALMMVFMDFLLNTPEGHKLGDILWEPGGMFESVPMYQKQPDGTMKRMPARLRSVPAAAQGDEA